MTMTDVHLHSDTSTLATQMDYARAVTASERGQSILPDAYKGNPANALIAIGLGQAMGLTPAESLYRIAVIKGKPSASAELIAANVRRAGHKLRVRVQEDPPKASATIVRADDPDEPLTIERDMAWAERMGLANEQNYRKQPATMLSYRAITACARLACPEALYGVAYTPDEAADIPDVAPAPPRVTAADFTTTAPTTPLPDVDSGETAGSDEPLITPAQSKKMHTLFGKLLGGDRAAGLAFATDVVGREVLTTKTLTRAEATKVVDALVKEAEAGSAAEPPADPDPFDGTDPWAGEPA